MGLVNWALRAGPPSPDQPGEVPVPATVVTTYCWAEARLAARPNGFAFSCKAHMRLTHIMKLKEAESFTEVFLKALEPLRVSRRLGPVLFQFAPSFKVDVERLAAYLPLLPRDLRFAFEFRHESWLTDAVYEQLGKHGVALCLAESEKLEVPKVFTADFAYFRLRKGDYTSAARQAI